MLVHPVGQSEDRGRASLVFPGSFNPLHDGHRRMAEIAAQIHGDRVAWEISVKNVDKPQLDHTEIRIRLAQFSDRDTVFLTRAATFVQKAQLFPEATFIVGADTLARIVASEYYRDGVFGSQSAVAFVKSQGCRFIVFGRLDPKTRFQTLGSLSLPAELGSICQEVPEAVFRDDISSSYIRSSTQRP